MTTRNHTEVIKASNGSLNGGRVSFGKSGTTTDNTKTVLWSLPLAEGEAVTVFATLCSCRDDETEAMGGSVLGVFRRAAAGDVTEVSTSTDTVKEDDAGSPVFAIEANTSTQTVDITVTAIAAENWRHEVTGHYTKV